MPHPGKVNVEEGHLFFGTVHVLRVALGLIVNTVGLLHVFGLKRKRGTDTLVTDSSHSIIFRLSDAHVVNAVIM